MEWHGIRGGGIGEGGIGGGIGGEQGLEEEWD